MAAQRADAKQDGARDREDHHAAERQLEIARPLPAAEDELVRGRGQQDDREPEERDLESRDGMRATIAHRSGPLCAAPGLYGVGGGSPLTRPIM